MNHKKELLRGLWAPKPQTPKPQGGNQLPRFSPMPSVDHDVRSWRGDRAVSVLLG